MRLLKTFLYATVSALLLFSCANRNRAGLSAADYITNMIGQQVRIPALTSTFLGRDSVISNKDTALTRLFVYYDSTSCQTCRVNNLYEWKDIISLEKNSGGKFELIMIFAPAEEDVVNLRRALARSRFLHPVYFDIERKLLKDNSFIPSHHAFHTFLTDKDGIVILAGDPVMNPDLYPLFLETVNTIIRQGGKYIDAAKNY